MKALLTALIVCALSQAASAVTLNLKEIKGGWIYNDLSEESGFAALMGGAEATLVNSGVPGGSTTVAIYTLKPLKTDKLQDDPKAWADVIIGKAKGTTIKTQRAYKAGNEWRYYAETLSDPEGNGEQQLHYAILAVVKNGRVVLFDYHQHKETYLKEVGAVKALYKELKIESL